MDVHVSPEVEEKLRALAANTGRRPEQVVEDAVRKYETSQVAALDWVSLRGR
jgi:predicted transcriptional regulator